MKITSILVLSAVVAVAVATHETVASKRDVLYDTNRLARRAGLVPAIPEVQVDKLLAPVTGALALVPLKRHDDFEDDIECGCEEEETKPNHPSVPHPKSHPTTPSHNEPANGGSKGGIQAGLNIDVKALIDAYLDVIVKANVEIKAEVVTKISALLEARTNIKIDVDVAAKITALVNAQVDALIDIGIGAEVKGTISALIDADVKIGASVDQIEAGLHAWVKARLSAALLNIDADLFAKVVVDAKIAAMLDLATKLNLNALMNVNLGLDVPAIVDAVIEVCAKVDAHIFASVQ